MTIERVVEFVDASHGETYYRGGLTGVAAPEILVRSPKSNGKFRIERILVTDNQDRVWQWRGVALNATHAADIVDALTAAWAAGVRPATLRKGFDQIA